MTPPGHPHPRRLRRDPRQGPARRAAHPAVAAGDGALRDDHLRHLPLRPRPHRLSGSLAAGVLWATLLFAALLGVNRLFVAEREEGGFDAIRLAPIDRSALFAAKATALLVLPRGAGAGRGADLRPLLPRLRRRRLGRSLAGPAPRRPRHRRHRHADLLDGGALARPRPARAARPPAPGRAADDRRDRCQRAAAWPWAVPVTTASAPGWRCSPYTI